MVGAHQRRRLEERAGEGVVHTHIAERRPERARLPQRCTARRPAHPGVGGGRDRKSTRLNSSHGYISYAVFCLKKKKQRPDPVTHCVACFSPAAVSCSRCVPYAYARSIADNYGFTDYVLHAYSCSIGRHAFCHY